MMRLTAVCVLAMAAWPAAEAQEPTSALEALIGARELRRGVGVYVTDDAGQRIKGTVIDLSGASLTVETGEGAKNLKAGAIRRIELQDTIESGIWIGVGLATAGSYARSGIASRRPVLLRHRVPLPAGAGRERARRRHARCVQAQDYLRGVRNQAGDGGPVRLARRTRPAGVDRVVSLPRRRTAHRPPPTRPPPGTRRGRLSDYRRRSYSRLRAGESG